MPACECRCITRCRGVRRRSLVCRETAKFVASFLSVSRGRRGRRHEQNVLFFCVRPAVKRRLCAHAKPGCGGAAFPGHSINRREGREGEEGRGWRRGGWLTRCILTELTPRAEGSDSAPVWSTDSTVANFFRFPSTANHPQSLRFRVFRTAGRGRRRENC